MKRLLIPLLLLSGCATPAVETKTVTVQVPVATHPVKAADVPPPVAPLGPKPKLPNGKTDVRRAGDILLQHWCEAVSYFLKADPLLRVSAGLPPQELPKYPECEDH